MDVIKIASLKKTQTPLCPQAHKTYQYVPVCGQEITIKKEHMGIVKGL
jgi:hypothetical protein